MRMNRFGLPSLLLAGALAGALAGCAMRPGRSAGQGGAPMSPAAAAAANEAARMWLNPALREEVPPPVFPNQKAPPFQFPETPPQTHGIDLTVHDRDTAERYFKWLCEHDAEVRVNRVVDDVESVFAMRHRPHYSSGAHAEVHHRFYLEDPWGETRDSSIMSTDSGNPYVPSYFTESEWILPGKQSLWYGPKGFHVYFPKLGYEFYERPVIERERNLRITAPYVRFERNIPADSAVTSDERDIHDFGIGNGRARTENRFRQPGEVWLWVPLVHQEQIRQPRPKAIEAPTSRYGFFWRGIQRSPQDRFLNIGGGEEYIVDFADNSIVAFRRNFVLADGTPGDGRAIDWARRKTCIATHYQWIQTVLRPADALARRGIDLKTHPTPEEVPGSAGKLNR